MNGKLDDRRVRKTKRALRQGLAQLLAEKNIKDISVRELTDLVDLHRGTFYLHYRDIYDLQAQIEQEILDEVNEILDQYPSEQIGTSPFPMILSLIQYCLENADLCRALLNENGDLQFVEQISAIVRQKCLHDWMEFYRGGDSEKFAFFSSYVVSGCVGVLRSWLDTGMKQSPEEVSAMLEKMAVYGCGFLREDSPT